MSYRNVVRKERKCKVCGNLFLARTNMQQTCSRQCETERKVKKNAQKKEKMSANKVAAKSKSNLLKRAQEVFNRFIRNKYKGMMCVSCGKGDDGTHQAGHFFPVGRCAATRFDERNVFNQCAECNMMKSGNIENYRKFLIREIGVDEFKRLEEDSRKMKKWSESELQEIIDKYSKMSMSLKG